ncbi:MAG: hypothetical protein E7773_11175 [Sphingomonas sp.]|uniref:hypothetical protein n=1 Tax=Sphingomonas sp. TaxID=28214 RepID=UPI0012066CA3|nr:hypothetical protein [Sphingomonas sp.]THD35022.1 MAG: hypothetical protein E7773_11175 [Sphingomonas sp.]
MSRGGDWRAFRDEIAELHAQDNTEEEYVELLKAHFNLMLLIDQVFDGETATKLHQIVLSEYLLFLNKEALQGGELINPVVLERITRREVEAGRLDPDSEARKLAVAGASVLGDSSRHDRSDGRNAVGGGATLGLIVGVILKFVIAGATWWIVGKAIVIGALIGLFFELLPRLFRVAR